MVGLQKPRFPRFIILSTEMGARTLQQLTANLGSQAGSMGLGPESGSGNYAPGSGRPLGARSLSPQRSCSR